MTLTDTPSSSSVTPVLLLCDAGPIRPLRFYVPAPHRPVAVVPTPIVFTQPRAAAVGLCSRGGGPNRILSATLCASRKWDGA